MKSSQIAQIIVVLLAALGVYSFARTARDAEARRVCTPLCALSPNYAARNRLAPDFELEALDGKRVRLSEYRGKVVIMNFWTKTCRPCLEELPSLADLGRMLEGHDDIKLITLCTDETADDARASLESVLGGDAPFTVLMDPNAEVVRNKYGTRLYPETWFIDPKGIIRARVDGSRRWDDALTIDFAESLSGPAACNLAFTKGRPRGPHAGLCGDLSG